MLKKSLIVLSLLSGLIYSGSVLAARSSHLGKITHMYTLGNNGTTVIYLDSSSDKCITSAGNPVNRFYLRLDQDVSPVSEIGYKSIYSSALTAFTADIRVRVYFDDETTTCDVDRIFLYRN